MCVGVWCVGGVCVVCVCVYVCVCGVCVCRHVHASLSVCTYASYVDIAFHCEAPGALG